jgi:hypothetical protein
VSQDRLDQAVRYLRVPVTTTKDLRGADAVMTLKNYYRRRSSPIKDAEAAGIPVYVLKNNTATQMSQCLSSIYHLDGQEASQDQVDEALQETEQAIDHVMQSAEPVDLSPQNAYIRRLQHLMAEKHQLASRSMGKDPHRRVQIYKE